MSPNVPANMPQRGNAAAVAASASRKNAIVLRAHEMKLILGSSSKYRKVLLQGFGFAFDTMNPGACVRRRRHTTLVDAMSRQTTTTATTIRPRVSFERRPIANVDQRASSLRRH